MDQDKRLLPREARPYDFRGEERVGLLDWYRKEATFRDLIMKDCYPFALEPMIKAPHIDIMPSLDQGRRAQRMTVALFLPGTDGIVLATDSRVTATGSTQWHSDTSNKLTVINESTALVSVGSAEFAAWLSLYFREKELMRKEIKDQASDLLGLVCTFSAFLKREHDFYAYNAYAKDSRTSYFALDFIFVGYQSHRPLVISTGTSSSCTPQVRNEDLPYHVAGITDVALYWLKKVEAEIKAGLPTDALAKLAGFVIQEAAKSDDRIGGEPNVGIVRDEKPVEILQHQEVDRLMKKVEDISGEKALVQLLRKL